MTEHSTKAAEALGLVLDAQARGIDKRPRRVLEQVALVARRANTTSSTHHRPVGAHHRRERERET
jgi:hypothetical protein